MADKSVKTKNEPKSAVRLKFRRGVKTEIIWLCSYGGKFKRPIISKMEYLLKVIIIEINISP
ncbi:hypothetical protein GCM10025861_04150 [Methanobacterium petrolearium]|nr:hypothetical protein GCM10025861_04150 [Methanobacterium petrolearium]